MPTMHLMRSAFCFWLRFSTIHLMNTEILVRMVFFNVLSVEIDNLLKKHLAIYLKLLSMILLKKMFTAKLYNTMFECKTLYRQWPCYMWLEGWWGLLSMKTVHIMSSLAKLCYLGMPSNTSWKNVFIYSPFFIHIPREHILFRISNFWVGICEFCMGKFPLPEQL